MVLIALLVLLNISAFLLTLASNVAVFGGIVLLYLGICFIDSINAKAQAQQIALQKQMEVQQATADAQKQVAQAQGYADSLTKRADAEAEANKKISQSLTPELVEWQKIQKWNGTLPQITSGAVPFVNVSKDDKR